MLNGVGIIMARRKKSENKSNIKIIRGVLGAFILVLIFSAFIIRFNLDTFIDTFLDALLQGVVIGIVIVLIFRAVFACFLKKQNN